MWVGNLFPCNFFSLLKVPLNFHPILCFPSCCLLWSLDLAAALVLERGGLYFPRAVQQPVRDEAQLVWSWERPARQENALSPDGVYPGLNGTAWLIQVFLASLSRLGDRAPTEWFTCCANLVGNGENCRGRTVALVRERISFVSRENWLRMIQLWAAFTHLGKQKATPAALRMPQNTWRLFPDKFTFLPSLGNTEEYWNLFWNGGWHLESPPVWPLGVLWSIIVEMEEKG